MVAYSTTTDQAVDLDAARQRLRFLDPEQPRHTYQLAPDTPGGPRRVLVGPLESNAEQLVRANGEGAGVYVMVNEDDLRGRKRTNVVRVRFAFVDQDETPLPAPEAHQARRRHLVFARKGAALLPRRRRPPRAVPPDATRRCGRPGRRPECVRPAARSSRRRLLPPPEGALPRHRSRARPRCEAPDTHRPRTPVPTGRG
jgi:hypothetical protein